MKWVLVSINHHWLIQDNNGIQMFTWFQNGKRKKLRELIPHFTLHFQYEAISIMYSNIVEDSKKN